jgi:hypothetical protein
MNERRHRGPYNDIEPLNKAIRMANWREQSVAQVALTPLLPLERIEVRDGQRVFLANALLALTREELIGLHEELRRSHQDCLLDGGDFTHPDIRAAQPHLYPSL